MNAMGTDFSFVLGANILLWDNEVGPFDTVGFVLPNLGFFALTPIYRGVFLFFWN